MATNKIDYELDVRKRLDDILRDFLKEIRELDASEQPTFIRGLEAVCAKGEAIEKILKKTAVLELYEALEYIIRELDKADIIKANSIFMVMPNKALVKARMK